MTQNPMNENRLCTRLITIVVAALCFCAPTLALCQVQPAHPRSAHSSGTQREKDDRELDALATRFYGIKSSDTGAIKKLKKLEREVSVFRKELSHRSYQASDIRKDARNLERRIAGQRKKLEAAAKAQHDATVSAAPVSAVSTQSVPAPATAVPPTPVAPVPVSSVPAAQTPAPASAVPAAPAVAPLPTPLPAVPSQSAPLPPPASR